MIIALFLFLSFQVSPDLRRHVEAALQAKNAGDLDTAIREFRRVVELAPTLPAAHVNLGAVYFDRKEYASAVPELEKALELDSNLPGAHAMLGAALLAQGYAAASLPHLEKGGTDDLIGVALLECDRPAEALEHLERALAARPNDPDLLYYAGRAHGQLSRNAFDRLQKSDPNSARAHQIAGEEMAASGNRDAAQRNFQAALAARPDLRDIHYSLGELYLSDGDYDKAETEFRAEARLVPGSAAAAYKLGFVLLHRGQLPDAIAELKRADRLQPGMSETLLQLGRALNSSGDAASAADCLEKLLQSENRTRLAEEAHYQLAQAYRRLGRTADADQQLKLYQQSRTR